MSTRTIPPLDAGVGCGSQSDRGIGTNQTRRLPRPGDLEAASYRNSIGATVLAAY
jgi:hypothetical protein